MSAEPAARPAQQPAFEGFRGRRGRLWRQHDFLLLWAAQGVSALGSQVTIVALPLTAVLVLHATALRVALLSTAATVSNLLGIPVGALLDRLRRRPVMIA